MTSATSQYLVIDLEAKCSEDRTIPGSERESIEIGALLVAGHDSTTIGERRAFVRPVRHQRLTDFCQRLTGIRQEEVVEAPLFPDVARELRAWIGGHQGNITFCSWGDYDRKQLGQDCAFHDAPWPIPGPHINIKRRFAEAHGLEKRPPLGQAIELAGLAFAGRPHRGIDDARSIARLPPRVFGGRRLS
jgi:inhibitor of KinA sporulation pathway (predicted exonuclease)